MQRQQSNQSTSTIKKIQESQYQLYKPSQVVKGCLSTSFQERFDELRKSFISGGIIAAFSLKNLKIWMSHKNRGKPQDLQQLEIQLPINRNPDFSCKKDKIKYTWIGHSTAVISVGEKTKFIIDPVFSERCSPYQWIGPKRFRQPACKIQQLPKIDMVLVSHDHYDHLDQNSLGQLHKYSNPLFLVGLQSRSCFPKNSNVKELDWTQTQKIQLNGQIFQVTFVPVCHWSRRGIFDQGKRLWGGFVVKTPKGKKIFYPGDTGYCGIFKQLGQIFDGFDLCILPIGAYEPRQLLKAQHFNPKDAVIVHKQLKSKKSVGVHWGTFPLAHQHWCSARQDLKLAATRHGLAKNQFITVGHGDSFEIDY